MSAPRAHRTAPDGSPYPDRNAPGFEHDVRAMFSEIADGYDTFDHIASLGQDLLWRPRALWALDRFRRGQPAPRRALDIGCGTGDLTRLTARHLRGASVVGADFTGPMVAIAADRTDGRAEAARVGYARASAMRLPFRSGSFDLVLSAFVVRNLPDLGQAFAELRRVLGPRGTLLTLEITEPASPFVARTFHAYFDAVVPWLGAAVGRAGPYRYLPESLRHLPPRSEMLARLTSAGFDRVAAVPHSGGIVTTYLAEAAEGSR
ncbi:MAG TPA: ubiquinone/menaquinone biosynthesis methyltransferase [Thermoplasmata archaeon]|nr:ubiquinone/menaquinone biosynthesis methyltransferase [Thermoplasmata archaeon]